MNLWQLDLDAAKTLFWSTRAQDRTALKRLGKQVVSQTADLGGAMRFCRRKGAGSQQVRPGGIYSSPGFLASCTPRNWHHLATLENHTGIENPSGSSLRFWFGGS